MSRPSRSQSSSDNGTPIVNQANWEAHDPYVLAANLRVNVVDVLPENTVEQQDRLLGKDLFARDPAQCCALRKVAPLRRTLAGYELWFIRFVQKLLEGDAQTLRLLRRNPFPDAPPKYIRATYYLYQFDRDAWWSRTRIDDYLPPIMARSV